MIAMADRDFFSPRKMLTPSKSFDVFQSETIRLFVTAKA
jgi:hypothetical protein